MKREFVEISDDEWENHSFKPSRVLKIKTQTTKPPPSIESFAFKAENHHKKLDENLEDEDVEEEGPVPVTINRGRRFIVDDDDEDQQSEGDFAELYEVKSSTEEDEMLEDYEHEEDDVVGKALQKCAKISAELKRELYGTSSTACDRYAEVEASSVRIVTQVQFLPIVCSTVIWY